MVPEEEKIASSQMMLLLITTVTATGFIFIPAITAKFAAQDAWISSLIPTTIFGLIAGFVCIKLGARFPDQSVVEYAPQLVGRVLGKLIGLSYAFLFLHNHAGVVQSFGGMMVDAFMPETPGIVFNISAIILAGLAIRHGMEVLARINQFMMPLFIGVLTLVLLLVVNEMDLSRIMPVMEKGIKPILEGSIPINGWRGQVFVILMFFPYLNTPKEATKTMFLAVLLTTVLVTAPTLAGILVFGPELNANAAFPTLNLVKYISQGMFLERIEVFIIVVWVGGLVAKIGVFYLASVLAIAHTFGVKNYRPLVTPAGNRRPRHCGSCWD